ncbi:ABC transporter permease [Haloquadratum walsbyi]|jgi:ABC-type dipeptide/oligopeptide/nickel transport systems, permease components|uniref:ABC-type dipeptide/oligopeptide/nickel transport system, permease component n=1 Tax=Haloquadratum walsbyi J07HQW2 TaxID=1238425 RepID=U1NCJ7_9EURY|nr:ABC transporter permease [Haloquadratum walsbyi]ERG94388.1 MAG: ABC-type dipeptide/oligopeptide/nickel transport system, permease component [Haloquadratum walsbyi J07HQW2]
MSGYTIDIETAKSRLCSELSRAQSTIRVVLEDNAAKVGFAIIMTFIFIGLFGPYLSPHHPIEHTMRSDGSMMRLEAPSSAAPLGTTSFGKDVLSQFLAGARPTIIVGVFGGVGTGVLGFLVGLTSGYFGGRVDKILMRLTDLTFALPFLPMALVVLSFVTPNIWLITAVLVVFLWKMPARVIRSEVMTVKERTFVKSARARGAGHLRTMFLHVAPNVLGIGFLYTAYAFGWSIVGGASLAFLGFGDPTTTSWGRMLEQVFRAGAMRTAWWWVLPPAFGIAGVTTAVFLVGRAFEELVNPDLQTKEK